MMQISAILSRRQQFVDLFTRRGDLFAVCMDIEILCHEEATMAANGLDGLGIDAGLIEQAQVAMPEDMSCRAVKIEVFLNVAEQPDVDHLGDGFVSANDKSFGFKRLK